MKWGGPVRSPHFCFDDPVQRRESASWRRNPDTVRAPDISYVRANRWSPGRFLDGFLPLAPDLAVEIVSPSESAEAVQEKVKDYLDAGTEQVWLLYRPTRSVVVHCHGGDSRVLYVGDFLDGGDVVPGFRITVAELFAK